MELVKHFFAKRGSACPEIDAETTTVLNAYAWPGNIRELENEVERIAALHPALRALTADMLSDRITNGAAEGALDVAVLHEAPLSSAVSHLEVNLLKKTLVRTNWNKSRSARELGLSRQGLLKKIKRYGIER